MTVVSDFTGILSGGYWNLYQGAPTSAFVTYSFETQPQSYLTKNGYSAAALATFKPLGAAEQAIARNAINQWAQASGIVAFEVPAGKGDIRFGAINTSLTSAGPASGYSSYPSTSLTGTGASRYDEGGDVFIDVDLIGSGSDLSYLFLHEIGHALGFKHPFDGSVTLDPTLDNRTNTVMSYNGAVNFNETLKPFDLQAVQQIYGANSSDGSQDASWSWNASTYSLFQTGTAGADSMLGVATSDALFGMAGDDWIAAFDGNDQMTGGAGDDMLDGGAGIDTAVYAAASTAATIVRHSGYVSIGTPSDGMDNVYRTEWAQFADRRVWIGTTRGDFDNDGASEILWKNASSGATYSWAMSGGQHVGAASLGNLAGWTALATADFDADGDSDILWRNQSSGDVYVWRMANGQHNNLTSANPYLGNLSGWDLAGCGQFDSDGTNDLIWQNQSDGSVWEWRLVNGQYNSSPRGNFYLGSLSGWSGIGTGDFNGDGTDDIIWRQQSTGSTWAWTMQDGVQTGGVYLGDLTGWNLVSSGDFNGDGTSDLLWMNSTGDVWEWSMSGGQHTGGAYLGNELGYSVVATGDYDGNGISDVVWQETSSGATWEWVMSNGQHATNVYLGALPGWGTH